MPNDGRPLLSLSTPEALYISMPFCCRWIIHSSTPFSFIGWFNWTSACQHLCRSLHRNLTAVPMIFCYYSGLATAGVGRYRGVPDVQLSSVQFKGTGCWIPRSNYCNSIEWVIILFSSVFREYQWFVGWLDGGAELLRFNNLIRFFSNMQM